MSHKPVIPTPAAQRWLDFRITWLPLIVCLIAVAGAVYVWNRHVFPASLVARVEGVRADVAHPDSGVVTRLYVSRFQHVNAGDPVAEVTPVDPRVLEASMGVIRADIELLQTGVSPSTAGQRMALDYDRIKLDWLRQKVTLATTKTELQLAESQLTRVEQLWKDKITSDAEYDIAKTQRDALKVSLEEHTRLIQDLEESLRGLSSSNDLARDTTNQLRASIAVQEQKLRLAEAELAPRVLTAPISGTVSMISKWCGEAVSGATPIVTISSSASERAVGFLRQPFYTIPTTNMLVEIRTRGFHRQVGVGRILAIDNHLLPINDVLLPPTKYNVAETGLPILVELPPELRRAVRPGEFIDITILPDRRGGGPAGTATGPSQRSNL